MRDRVEHELMNRPPDQALFKDNGAKRLVKDGQVAAANVQLFVQMRLSPIHRVENRQTHPQLGNALLGKELLETLASDPGTADPANRNSCPAVDHLRYLRQVALQSCRRTLAIGWLLQGQKTRAIDRD